MFSSQLLFSLILWPETATVHESVPHTLREEDVMGISALRELVCAERNSQTPLQPRDGSETTK